MIPETQPALTPNYRDAAEPRIYPRQVIRIVLQVMDTPENRVACATVYNSIRSIAIPDIKGGVLKFESITFDAASFPIHQEHEH